MNVVNGINLTESICYPRSGHKLLADILGHYFGERWGYCERYKHPELRIGFTPTTNYEKNHDFDLDTPILDDRLYVVQVRDALDAACSWQQLMIDEAGLVERGAEHYRFLMQERVAFFSRFCAKWVFSDIKNRIVVVYRDLIERPRETVSAVLAAMEPTGDVNNDRMLEAVAAEEPGRRPEKRLRHCRLA